MLGLGGVDILKCCSPVQFDSGNRVPRQAQEKLPQRRGADAMMKMDPNEVCVRGGSI
jgi:hypothetical protein